MERAAARRPPPTLAPAIGKGISLFRRLPAGRPWAELAAALGGGGVADLAVALRRRELADELATFRSWLAVDLLGWLERGEPAVEDDEAAEPALPAAAGEVGR